MPKDKTASHVQVEAAMRAEFLEKGFEDASVRSIAARAGMSAAGLYQHYKNKEDMFDALMQPLLLEMNEWLEHHRTTKYNMVDTGEADREMLFGESFIDLVKNVLYPCREEFKLLLGGARGTKYEDFIHNFVKGENGSELSGGERQRISIARALLKDAPIILLDEATAPLDVENETKIQQALSHLIRNKTVLIIAHRMRTIANADHIVVLRDGTVAEQGTPEALLEKDGIYKHMTELQLQSAEWRMV